MILIIKHIDIEGPGTIGTYFHKKGYTLKTIDLDKGDPLPDNFSDVEAVICLGGPMNVYEEDRYPFLVQENQFIQKVIKEGIPYLGICLGSQLLAKAAGAKVIKSPVPEVGWYKVDVKADGQSDPLLEGLGKEFDVFHWHEDMFEIPLNGKFLATATGCSNQAFKIGKSAYGVQFHVEVTGEIIKDWCKNYFKSSNPQLQQKARDMIAVYEKKKDAFNARANQMYANFEKMILQRKAVTA